MHFAADKKSNMKKYLLMACCCLAVSAYTQKGYMDKITDSACKCVEAVKAQVKTMADFDKVGEECLMNATTPYLDSIAKEENIPAEEFTEDTWNKIGQKIGVRLAGNCPAFVKLIAAFPDAGESAGAVTGKVSGVIAAVQITDHVYITIKEPSGTITKLAWVYYFPGSDDYKANPAKLKGKKVEANWTEDEIYVIAKKDFVVVKVLGELVVK